MTDGHDKDDADIDDTLHESPLIRRGFLLCCNYCRE
jgi:hypothetical protein